MVDRDTCQLFSGTLFYFCKGQDIATEIFFTGFYLLVLAYTGIIFILKYFILPLRRHQHLTPAARQ